MNNTPQTTETLLNEIPKGFNREMIKIFLQIVLKKHKLPFKLEHDWSTEVLDALGKQIFPGTDGNFAQWFKDFAPKYYIQDMSEQEAFWEGQNTPEAFADILKADTNGEYYTLYFESNRA